MFEDDGEFFVAEAEHEEATELPFLVVQEGMRAVQPWAEAFVQHVDDPVEARPVPCGQCHVVAEKFVPLHGRMLRFRRGPVLDFGNFALECHQVREHFPQQGLLALQVCLPMPSDGLERFLLGGGFPLQGVAVSPRCQEGELRRIGQKVLHHV